MLRRDALQTKGIISGLSADIKKIAPFAPLAAGALILGKLGDQAYDFSREFEMAMKEVETISQATKDNLKGISDAVIDLSANGPDSANELAKGLYQIVSAGYDGAKGLEILDISAKLATGSLTSVYTSADALTSVLNAYGDKAGSVTSISDKFFEVVKNGKTTMGELGSNIVNVTGLAAQAGVKLDDLFAAYSTGTKTLRTEEFTTGLRGFLTAIIKPSDDALQTAKQLGIEFNTEALAVKGLSNFLQDLMEKTQGNVDVMATLFPNVRGLNGVLAIGAEGGKKYADQLKNIEEAYGNTEKAATTMMEAVDNKWKQVHNRWMRELKDLGNQLKLTSASLADLMNDMMRDNQADVINPGIANGLSKIRAELEGIDGKENKLEFITNQMIKYQETVRKLAADETKTEANKPSYWERNNERIWGSLGFRMRGRENEVELEYIRNQIEIYRGLLDEVAKLHSEVIKSSGAVTSSAVSASKKPWVVSDSLSIIEELKSKLGTVNVQQEVEVRFQIADEQVKIEEFYQKVRDAFTKAINEGWSGTFSRTTGVDGTNSKLLSKTATNLIADQANKYRKETQEITKQLQPMKRLTSEEIQRNEILSEQIDKLDLQRELYNDIADGLKDTSTLLGAISYAVGEVDDELGSAVGRMADIAMNASNLMGNLATGNTVGAIASGIGIIGNILGLFNNEKEEKTVSALDRINQSLETQSMLLASLSGDNWFLLAAKQADDYRQKIDDSTKALQSLNVFTTAENDKMRESWEQHKEAFPYFTGSGPISWSDYKDLRRFVSETTGWDIDKFIEAWGNGEIVLSESAKEYISQAIEAQKGLDNLYADLTLLTGDSLADSIIEGFKSGKTAMEDFVGDFETMMQNAVLNALSKQILLPLLQGWNEQLYNYMNDQDGLTEDEIAILKGKYSDIIDIGNTQVEALQKITGLNLTGGSEKGYEPLQGISRSITEETGSLLVGQFMSMREYQVRANDSMLDQLAVAEESLEVLQEIRDNTAFNKHLETIDANIVSMNNNIKTGLGV